MPSVTRGLGAISQNPYSIGAIVPGLQGLTGGASRIIQSELGGLPDPSEARTANAAWGAGAGLPPGTDFLENRGRRLYRSETEQRQRQGIQDLLAFLRGVSGTVSATPGQLLEVGQQQQRQSFEERMARIQDEMNRRKLEFERQKAGFGVPWSGRGGSNVAGQTWGQYYDRAGLPVQAYY